MSNIMQPVLKKIVELEAVPAAGATRAQKLAAFKAYEKADTDGHTGGKTAQSA